jgi:4-oxalocrotonate tautomerase
LRPSQTARPAIDNGWPGLFSGGNLKRWKHRVFCPIDVSDLKEGLDKTMPHISVKMFPGKTEEQKQEFAAKVVEAAKAIFGSTDASLSVAISEVEPPEWETTVYGPDIAANEAALYKRPGYGDLAKA